MLSSSSHVTISLVSFTLTWYLYHSYLLCMLKFYIFFKCTKALWTEIFLKQNIFVLQCPAHILHNVGSRNTYSSIVFAIYPALVWTWRPFRDCFNVQCLLVLVQPPLERLQITVKLNHIHGFLITSKQFNQMQSPTHKHVPPPGSHVPSLRPTKLIALECSNCFDSISPLAAMFGSWFLGVWYICPGNKQTSGHRHYYEPIRISALERTGEVKLPESLKINTYVEPPRKRWFNQKDKGSWRDYAFP